MKSRRDAFASEVPAPGAARLDAISVLMVVACGVAERLERMLRDWTREANRR
jgi:hypothetical protein